MTTPTLNAAPTRKGPNQLIDAFFWSVAAIAIGVAGFWYPLWRDSQFAAFERQNHVDLDTRMGFLYMFSLPVILIFAILATISLGRSYWSASGWTRVALLLVLAVLCWSPLIFIGIGMIWNR